MTQGYFVTGTDTGIGKTWSTIALMQYFKNQGKTVVGMKPVASGCERIDGQLKNEDALLLQQHASLALPYQDVNPYAFAMPVSPHIAAEQAGAEIVLKNIIDKYQKIEKLADVVLVEGVGGWLVPLNAHQDVADLARELDLPVILVVGMRLGCINQAKTTFAALQKSGVKCQGWIASCVEKDMLMLDENIQSLCLSINAPLLAVFPYMETLDPELFSEEFICEI
ncbi:dethiobiotin synthetase [Bathymodiolus platifrons methanotrophic gill symbiont]|uniref:dethiobiotin synthase n=1 Tax=Bathymodiolus platifrons methanotrophic gill symbiont TaxID=113268 RepID=UPI000B40CB29|nr:dethiobiotin synthase [Bathymodiolus platifrons methanotrophic gill symbiont]MCK5869211.1 dethiobiotin synthase [Methyloprofundus sp.]TXK96637.1 dethiobiotin synthase [Methylococcaceae bacterium CS4]TXK99846.1 dethiobiotin synthase [Methylococcaceae bacterium CS5]TXL06471.1 dethiobiotin synthase [Methylococcaceae bacterium CS1]TXL07232.1 dethiobiotin synthase [Methylococcaceae bacterium CS3]TXL10863.1 dethiobiotin synthase [Methylococcaceae bacterium CS2]TXL14434.1 dethiobiotin synthase [